MPATTMQTIENRTDHASNGGRLAGVDGEQLPLESATLQATATGGLARTTLKQVFGNPHREPLQVVYTMPLPADGAVSGYQFRVGDRLISGEVKPRETAREDFERALVEGRTAGLLEQERSNLFTQQLGNVPPGEKVTVELTIDQKLTWLSEGMWEWRFPTVAGPRYLGAEGRVPDAGKVTVQVGDRPLPVRAGLELSIGDLLGAGPGPESPSHKISIQPGEGKTGVTLATEDGTRLDRDVVVRWAVPRPRPGVTLQSVRRDGAVYGLLTIVPPESPVATLPRDLIMLIDTSGSMHGDPLNQAKRVARAVIDSLQETDSLEMISFSSAPRRWRSSAVNMAPGKKLKAHGWIDQLQSGGATEMCDAVKEALRPLRSEGIRQIILITDGYIGFESEVVSALRSHLPVNSRLHAVGVGSAVNTALLYPAARAGRGVKVIVGLDEDVERGAARLLAATREPVVSGIRIDGEAVTGRAPSALPDLLAGAPVLASLALRPEGGRIMVSGHTAEGAWEQPALVPPADDADGNPAVSQLYARESVEDLEIDLAAGGERHRIDSAIERLGVEFQIATRLTSWVAVSDQTDVDPGSPTRRSIVPQELPYGTSAEGLALRSFQSMDWEHIQTLSLDAVQCDEALRPRSMPESERALLKSSGSILSRLSDLPSGVKRSPSTPDGTDEQMAGKIPESSLPPEAERVFGGRWIGAGLEHTHTVEFEVIGESLSWSPGDVAIVVLKDGGMETVDLEVTQGTAPGTIAAGCLVRLALKTAPINRDEILAVFIVLDGVRIGIEM